MPAPQVEALLPVYNEAEIIESTIREWRDELTPRVAAGFIICEDGSEDGTRGILERLGRELPVRLNLRGSRRGYSQAAVRDGMRMPQSDYLLCVDSDGQCDPKDFWRFREARGTADLILGRRLERADPALRRAFRRVSYCIYQPVLRTPAHDPSCPYALMSKRTVARLVDELSDVREGFWWEFVARAHRFGFGPTLESGTVSSSDSICRFECRNSSAPLGSEAGSIAVRFRSSHGRFCAVMSLFW
jgi:glycosyltransferase involved in cell wall biosynthesis